MADSARKLRSEARRRRILENAESRLRKAQGESGIELPKVDLDTSTILSTDDSSGGVKDGNLASANEPSHTSSPSKANALNTDSGTTTDTHHVTSEGGNETPLLTEKSESSTAQSETSTAQSETSTAKGETSTVQSETVPIKENGTGGQASPHTEEPSVLPTSPVTCTLLRSSLMIFLGAFTYFLIVLNHLTNAVGPFVSLELVLFTLWPISSLVPAHDLTIHHIITVYVLYDFLKQLQNPKLPALLVLPIQLLKMYWGSLGDIMDGLTKAGAVIIGDFIVYLFSFITAYTLHSKVFLKT